jgi:hypothetical protein
MSDKLDSNTSEDINMIDVHNLGNLNFLNNSDDMSDNYLEEPKMQPEQLKITPAPVQAQRPTPAQVQAQRPAPAQVQAQRPAPAQVQAQRPAPVQAQAQRPAPAQVQVQRPAPAQVQAQRPAPAQVQAPIQRPTQVQAQAQAQAQRPQLQPELIEQIQQNVEKSVTFNDVVEEKSVLLQNNTNEQFNNQDNTNKITNTLGEIKKIKLGKLMVPQSTAIFTFAIVLISIALFFYTKPNKKKNN